MELDTSRRKTKTLVNITSVLVSPFSAAEVSQDVLISQSFSQRIPECLRKMCCLNKVPVGITPVKKYSDNNLVVQIEESKKVPSISSSENLNHKNSYVQNPTMNLQNDKQEHNSDLSVLPTASVIKNSGKNFTNASVTKLLDINSSINTKPASTNATATASTSTTATASTSTTVPVFTSTTAPVFTSTSVPVFTSTTAPVFTSTTAPVFTSTSVPVFTSTSVPVITSTAVPVITITTPPGSTFTEAVADGTVEGSGTAELGIETSNVDGSVFFTPTAENVSSNDNTDNSINLSADNSESEKAKPVESWTMAETLAWSAAQREKLELELQENLTKRNQQQVEVSEPPANFIQSLWKKYGFSRAKSGSKNVSSNDNGSPAASSPINLSADNPDSEKAKPMESWTMAETLRWSAAERVKLRLEMEERLKK